MIDFYDAQYVLPVTRYSNVANNGLWPMESKIAAYKKDLKILNDQLIQVLNSSTLEFEALSTSDPDYNTYYAYYNIIKTKIQDLEGQGSLQYLFEGEAGLLPADNCWDVPNGTSISSNCIFSMLLARTKPPAVSEPIPAEIESFSDKVTSYHDTFFGRFNEYYMMTRQLNNFECKYMPTFRGLYIFSNGIMNGGIFGYFDILTENLYNAVLAIITDFNTYFTERIAAGGTNTINNVMQDIVTGNAGRSTLTDLTILTNNYEAEVRTGITEMENIFDIAQDFLISLYWGIRVISTANIVLTSSDADHDILIHSSREIIGQYDPEVAAHLSNETRVRLANEMRIAAYVTQIAIQFKAQILPDFSNFEYILSKTVGIGLTQTGCISKLDNLNALVATYTPQTI